MGQIRRNYGNLFRVDDNIGSRRNNMGNRTRHSEVSRPYILWWKPISYTRAILFNLSYIINNSFILKWFNCRMVNILISFGSKCSYNTWLLQNGKFYLGAFEFICIWASKVPFVRLGTASLNTLSNSSNSQLPKLFAIEYISLIMKLYKVYL